jgi:hypothetical protein
MMKNLVSRSTPGLIYAKDRLGRVLIASNLASAPDNVAYWDARYLSCRSVTSWTPIFKVDQYQPRFHSQAQGGLAMIGRRSTHAWGVERKVFSAWPPCQGGMQIAGVPTSPATHLNCQMEIVHLVLRRALFFNKVISCVIWNLYKYVWG